MACHHTVNYAKNIHINRRNCKDTKTSYLDKRRNPTLHAVLTEQNKYRNLFNSILWVFFLCRVTPLARICDWGDSLSPAFSVHRSEWGIRGHFPNGYRTVLAVKVTWSCLWQPKICSANRAIIKLLFIVFLWFLWQCNSYLLIYFNLNPVLGFLVQKTAGVLQSLDRSYKVLC